MATQPKTVRETALVIEGIESRLGLITKLILAGVGFLGALVIGAITTYGQLSSLSGQVAQIKEDIKEVQGNLSKLSDVVTGFDAKQDRILADAAGARPDLLDRNSDYILDLIAAATEQTITIREIINAPPKTEDPSKLSIGELVEESTPLPEELIAKIPMLKDVTYVLDVNNAIALIDPRTRRVFAIV